MRNVKSKIAITGCIGAGKSCVAQLFREAGFYVFDVDKCNSELLCLDSTVKILENDFSDAIINHQVDKQKMANIIFNDSQKRHQLEQIMHKLILQKMLKEMADHPLFLAEVPTLFEAGWQKYFDKIIMVYAPYDVVIERLLAKGYTKDKANKILDIQMDPQIKIGKSNHVIYNDGSYQDLKIKVNNFIKECL